MTVPITDDELDAVFAALDGYEAYRCTNSDHYEDHGDETACEGWGPKGLADLASGQEALARLARRGGKTRETRMEVQS